MQFGKDLQAVQSSPTEDARYRCPPRFPKSMRCRRSSCMLREFESEGVDSGFEVVLASWNTASVSGPGHRDLSRSWRPILQTFLYRGAPGLEVVLGQIVLCYSTGTWWMCRKGRDAELFVKSLTGKVLRPVRGQEVVRGLCILGGVIRRAHCGYRAYDR